MMRPNTVGSLIIASTSAVYFASGMMFGRGQLGKSATKPLLVCFGVAAVLFMNAALWGLAYLLRRIGKAQQAENPNK